MSCELCLIWLLSPINNLSVIYGWVFLGWTNTKQGLMFLLKDITQWRRWGSNLRPLSLGSITLPLSHCVPMSCELTKKCKKIASSELSLTADWQSWTPNFGAGTLILKDAKFFSMAARPLFCKEGSWTSHMYKNVWVPHPWNQPLGTMGKCTDPGPPLYNCKMLNIKVED